MGQFIKSVFASCLGVILAIFLLGLISTLVVSRIATVASKPTSIQPNSVLKLKFSESIPDKTNNLEASSFNLKNDKVLGLQEIIATINEAKKDDDIKGILIESEYVPLGFSSLSNLRQTILDFKADGKFVISYAKYYEQGGYYLASASDKVYANPIGLVDFRGPSATVPFYKDLLDKIGVKMEIFYAGKFKSATEPYRRTNMSEEAKMQVREFLNERYNTLINDISASRKIDVAKLKQLANDYIGADPNDAARAGLIDAVGSIDLAYDDIRQRIGLDDDEKIQFVSLKSYNLSHPPKVDYAQNSKIAVIYAEGTVVDGTGEYGTIGDDRYTKIIDELAEDNSIKAIVLRVNSPGGSAMSSENIWRSLMNVKETGVPVVVSMGDYAASGGYYIACPADKIVAEPNTLTGSIGVFSMFPNATKLLNEKLGVRFDSVKTGKLSTGITPYFDLSEQENNIMQRRTDSLYMTFLNRVSEGRKIPVNQVNEMAQGRVWTGAKAKELGLVDEIGNLQDAIDLAAEMADIEAYRIAEYPKVKDQMQQLLDEFLLEEEEDFSFTNNLMLKKELGEWYPMYKYLKEVRESRGMQMRLPFILDYN